MAVSKASYYFGILGVAIPVASAMPCFVVAAPDVKPQSRCVSLSHHAFHLICYIRVEGKKINYLLLVFQEEIVVSYFPSFHYNIMMVFEQLLRFWIVAHIMESSHRQHPHLCCVFCHSIGEEVVPSCMADVKILVFICKTH